VVIFANHDKLTAEKFTRTSMFVCSEYRTKWRESAEKGLPHELN